MSLDHSAILNAVESHALSSGYFERVNRHEVDNAPGNGITAEIWVQRLAPVALASGLAATSALLHLNVRLRLPITSDPGDAIDPAMLDAAVALISAYSGDFEFGGNIRNVDLLGAYGIPLQFTAGYLSQDGMVFRVYTIDLPLVVNDVFPQAP